MKNLVLILLAILAVGVTPVLASKDDSRKESEEMVKQEQNEDCDPELEWKNHGQYVSCVAKKKLGGEVVSQAARSDIGKKAKSATPSVTPTATPTTTLTPTTTPNLTPTGTISAMPTSTPSGEVESQSRGAQIIELKALVEVLKQILESLKHLGKD